MRLSQGRLDGKGTGGDLLDMWEGWDAGLCRYTLRKRQHMVVSLYFGYHKLRKKSVAVNCFRISSELPDEILLATSKKNCRKSLSIREMSEWDLYCGFGVS